MPDTAPWREVVKLLADDAQVAEVASATTKAAVRGLELAHDDEGLACSFLMLCNVVEAARQENFADSLRERGMTVPDAPGVFDIVGGFAGAVDDHLHQSRNRTDLSEMAELAAVESLSSLLGDRSSRLYGTTSLEVQQAARELSSDNGFGTLAHDFFSRFTKRFLTYHLDRELSFHVGGNGRFADPSEHNEFLGKLDVHCREAAGIMRTFATDWYAKANSPQGKGINLKRAKHFTNHVLTKLEGELKRRGARHGE